MEGALLNRELLAQWSCIDWDAFGHDDAAATTPLLLPQEATTTAVAAATGSSSINAQLREEHLRHQLQQEQDRGEHGGGNKRGYAALDDDVEPPLQWPPGKRVRSVDGAHRMSIFDEWVWLVYIGNNGVTAFNCVMQGKATRRDRIGCISTARFLNTYKLEVVQRQKDRMEYDADGERARSRKQFDTMAPAFLRQSSDVFTVRAFSRNWCKANVHVLQWLSDFAGAPVALVHRGCGWVAEYLPRSSGESITHKYPPFTAGEEEETEAETMAHHVWRPASNCIVLYIRHDSNAVGGLAFGVELAPERIAPLPWFSTIVRLRSPYCVMADPKKYSINSLRLLQKRIIDTRRSASDEVDGHGRVTRAMVNNNEEKLPPRQNALFKMIASALAAY